MNATKKFSNSFTGQFDQQTKSKKNEKSSRFFKIEFIGFSFKYSYKNFCLMVIHKVRGRGLLCEFFLNYRCPLCQFNCSSSGHPVMHSTSLWTWPFQVFREPFPVLCGRWATAFLPQPRFSSCSLSKEGSCVYV